MLLSEFVFFQLCWGMGNLRLFLLASLLRVVWRQKHETQLPQTTTPFLHHGKCRKPFSRWIWCYREQLKIMCGVERAAVEVEEKIEVLRMSHTLAWLSHNRPNGVRYCLRVVR